MCWKAWLDVSYCRAFKASMRRAVAETWAQDTINQANQEGRLPVKLPEPKLNFVARVNAAMHQFSNGGDQHRLGGWNHLHPNSEEEFVDVLENGQRLCTRRMNSSGTRSLPHSRTMRQMLKTSKSGRTTMLRKMNRRTKWRMNQSLPMTSLHIMWRRSHVPRSHPDLPCAHGSLFACSAVMRLQRTLLLQLAVSDDRGSTSTCRRVQ